MSVVTGHYRQYEWTERDRPTGQGHGVGRHMEWEGHTYRGGSAGYAHKPNSN